MKFYTTVRIIRKKYEDTESAKYIADLHLSYDENGIIRDREFEFKDCYIDLCTTKAWFKINNSNFRTRKKLFDYLGDHSLFQKERTHRYHHELKRLDPEQLAMLSDFFNQQYDSTVKNIYGLIKGNNPSGEWERPDSAEIMVFEAHDMMMKIPVKLMDDLMLGICKRARQFDEDDEHLDDADAPSSSTKKLPIWKNRGDRQGSFLDIVSKNHFLMKMLELMRKTGSVKRAYWHNKSVDKTEYEKMIKEYVKNHSDIFDEIEYSVKKYRTRYNKNIEIKYRKPENKLPFGIKWADLEESTVQRCHILNVSWIKERLLKIMLDSNLENCKNSKCIKLLAKIEDPDNFLPLGAEVHRPFDRNLFWYTEDGKCHFREGLTSGLLSRIDKYSPIDEYFLTEKRKEYIRERLKEFGINNCCKI